MMNTKRVRLLALPALALLAGLPAMPQKAAGSPAAAPLPFEQLDTKPCLLRSDPPQYPAGLKKLGLSGKAVLSFVVQPDGQVSDLLVEEATQQEFAQAALEAVGKWQFSPGTKDGEPVACRVTVPIVFAPAAAKAKS